MHDEKNGLRSDACSSLPVEHVGDYMQIEEYLNDPKQTAPAELLTEIYVPLQ
ncbi:GyrI-like domain-containing protein [Paraburkholderia rhizosphaerae]|uniref:GyrI-like domain-containing protein n=1 Tax=Paraburkholderia rhizosphaerae TaxID=480658 RepID=UPI0010655E55|nr:GyrI-like domain-containing protein [Paraburkholderia rhizosphaerae]